MLYLTLEDDPFPNQEYDEEALLEVCVLRPTTLHMK